MTPVAVPQEFVRLLSWATEQGVPLPRLMLDHVGVTANVGSEGIFVPPAWADSAGPEEWVHEALHWIAGHVTHVAAAYIQVGPRLEQRIKAEAEAGLPMSTADWLRVAGDYWLECWGQANQSWLAGSGVDPGLLRQFRPGDPELDADLAIRAAKAGFPIGLVTCAVFGGDRATRRPAAALLPAGWRDRIQRLRHSFVPDDPIQAFQAVAPVEWHGPTGWGQGGYLEIGPNVGGVT